MRIFRVSGAKLQKSFYTLLFSKKLEIRITLLVEVFTPLAVKSQCVLREHAPAVNLIYPLYQVTLPPSPLISYRRAPAGMAGLAGLKPGSCCVGCNHLAVSFVVW